MTVVSKGDKENRTVVRDKVRRSIIINGIEKQDRQENVVEIVRNVCNVDIESNIVKCHRKDRKKTAP